ncbi:hypothetical protein IWZ01DRAFT_251093 [Phyllosticta capitalensis]
MRSFLFLTVWINSLRVGTTNRRKCLALTLILAPCGGSNGSSYSISPCSICLAYRATRGRARLRQLTMRGMSSPAFRYLRWTFRACEIAEDIFSEVIHTKTSCGLGSWYIGGLSSLGARSNGWMMFLHLLLQRFQPACTLGSQKRRTIRYIPHARPAL